MESADATGWETAVLAGGPADGVRVKVTGRPWVIQVTCPCRLDSAPDGVHVEVVYVYRRDVWVKGEPLRYGFDVASP